MLEETVVELNDMRNRLREEEIRNIEEGKESYTSSVYYIDLISEIERMGDYVINISQAL
jgi:phosphate:Na+ symporter